MLVRLATLALLTASTLILTAPTANAQTYYWDSNGTTAGAGDTPTGTWGVDNFWNTDSTGGAGTFVIPTLSTSDLFFSAGSDAINAYTVGLNSATQNARLLTFKDGTASLNSGTLSLGTGGGITVTSNSIVGSTISSNLTISGVQTFNVAASRTLTLDTGTFTRNAGATLNVASTGSVTTTMTGLNSASLVNGIIGPWASYGSGGSTRYATIDASNNIVGFTGTSSTVAAIGNTPTVNYEVSAVGTLGTGANINTLRYNGAAGTIAGALTTTGILNVSGNALTFSGTVTGSGELVVNTANGDVSFNAANAAGSYGLIKAGSGRLTTANLDTAYSGTVTVNGGVLQYGDNIGRLTSGNITLNGGIIESRWSGAINRTQGSGAGQIQILGGESGFSLNGNTGMNVNIGAVTWGSGTFNPSKFVLQSAASQGNSSVVIQSASTFDLGGATRTILVNSGVAGNASATIQGAISNGGLIKEGAGLLILSATNNYAAGTTINAGTLAFGSIAAMPSTGVVAVNNSTLGIDLGTAGDWTTATSGVGTLGGLLSGVGGAGTSTVIYSGNVGLRLNVGADSTYAGVIANPAGTTSLSLTKVGASVLTLTNDNSFTGAVNLQAGTLRLENTNAIENASGVNALTGTTLQLRSNTAATFATPLTTLNTNGNNQNITINVDRVSSGSGNQLVLSGGLSSQQNHGNETTLNFAGANGYTLSVPTLTINRFGGGGSGGGTILNATTDVAIGTASLNSTQNLFVRLTGTSTGNTLGAMTQSSGTFRLQKQGSGTWRLTGSNSYTGTNDIRGGVLEVAVLANGGSASGLGQSSNAAANVLLGNGATLRYVGSANATTDRSFTIDGTEAGHGATIESSGMGTLTYSGGPAIAYGTPNQTRTLTLGGTNTGANTFGKVIANNGSGTTSLTKAGAGTWVLNQANTYTGGTSIDAGTLIVNNTTGSGTGTGAVLVGADGTLGGTGFISGLVTVDGTLAPGSGTAGTLTLNGGLTMNAGSTWGIVLADGTSNTSLAITGPTSISDFTNFRIDGNDFAFDPSSPYNYVIATGAGNQSLLNINTIDNFSQFSFSNFGNSADFHFFITGNSSGQIFLNANPVPEPSTVLAMGTGFLGLCGLIRRRRKTVEAVLTA